MAANASKSSASYLEIFAGRTSPAAASLYVRAPGLGAECRLSGRIAGPECLRAATLQADFTLEDLGSDPQPLARATITEPCFWTPRTPYVYQAHVQVTRQGQVGERYERLCAARPWGAHGRNLVLAGKRWVLRGVGREELRPEDLGIWIEAAAVACVPNPSDAVCSEASVRGLGIAARVEGTIEGIQAELARLAQWPAVLFALLPANTPASACDGVPPGLLLGQLPNAEEPYALRPWARVLLASAEGPADHAERLASLDVPVIVVGRSDEEAIHDARRHCDRLQAALAPVADFAGYLV
jgi:hypothetical protein